MGSGSSGRAKRPGTDKETAMPWRQRKALLRAVRLLCDQPEEDRDNLSSKINELKQIFGIALHGEEEEHEDEDINEEFLLDETAKQLVLELADVVESETKEWIKEVDWIIHTLAMHISPPVGQSTMPHPEANSLTTLNLTNINLSKRILMVQNLISGNRLLTNIEMAFTGVSNKEVIDLLPGMAKLPSLNYLGLKGNMLDKGIFPKFVSRLTKPKQLAALIWVDFRNNMDIWTLPLAYTQELKKRWPKNDYQPTLRDLAEGKVVVKNGAMEMNI